MHAADDDSVPVPHDAFRVPRGALKWKAPYRTALLLLGGAYAVLALAGRRSSDLEQGAGMRDPLRLPLLLQLALGALGLAALVWVLSRAVREVDKRPYVAIAPVFATFAALVHMGLPVELPLLGATSALVATGVLAVALIGGALIVRSDAYAQRLGWGLVVAPWLLLMLALELARGDASYTSSERAYTLGLLFSSLVLGAAGVASRTLRGALTRASATSARHEDSLAGSSTHVVQAPALGAGAWVAVYQKLRAAALQLPAGRLRLVCVVLATTAVVSLGLRSVWPDPSSAARRAPRAAPAARPPIPAGLATPVVQQLSVTTAVDPKQPGHGDDGARQSPPASRQPTSVTPPISTRSTNTAAAFPARKPAPTAGSRTRTPASPVGLPAWGDLASIKPRRSASKTLKPAGR